MCVCASQNSKTLKCIEHKTAKYNTKFNDFQQQQKHRICNKRIIYIFGTVDKIENGNTFAVKHLQFTYLKTKKFIFPGKNNTRLW